MFRLLGRRTSETSFGFLFYVTNVVFLNFLMNWFSNHRVFEQSIKDSQTRLVFSHCSIQMCWLWFRSWTCYRISSRFTSLTFIKLFGLNLRLKTSLNFFFLLLFLFIAQMLDLSFSILNVIVHSVDELLFLRRCHLFTEFSPCSFDLHCFEFLLKL